MVEDADVQMTSTAMRPGLVYIPGVTTIALDEERCNGCLLCLKVCPHPVFGPLRGAVQILEPDLRNCTEEALSVNPGVGCAGAILKSWLTRSDSSCDCG